MLIYRHFHDLDRTLFNTRPGKHAMSFPFGNHENKLLRSDYQTTTVLFHMFPLLRLSRLAMRHLFFFGCVRSVYPPPQPPTPGGGSQIRSISMPAGLFKESVHGLVCCAATQPKFVRTSITACMYGAPEGAFVCQYLPEKKLKQKELEKKSEQ